MRCKIGGYNYKSRKKLIQDRRMNKIYTSVAVVDQYHITYGAYHSQLHPRPENIIH